jgi:hypothetical protein
MTFPAIKPSSRSYSPGQLPIRSYRTLGGAVWKRAFSDTRAGHAMRLEFANIPDSVADQIVGHYETMGGPFYRFDLPNELMAGYGTALANRVKAPANVKWAYATEPSVASVHPGFSTVTVELVGEVDYS